MKTLSYILPLLPLTLAVKPPSLTSMKTVFSESFSGNAGSSPSSKWTIAKDIDTNAEAQTYTSHASNVQLSGGSTIQIVPWKSESGDWTSGRVETKDSWTPSPNKKMRYQASIRLGDNLGKQGMWPAFWMLGDAVRHGTEWPLCGELDIFEQVDGVMTGYGTAHCSSSSGGACNEPTGLQGSTDMPDDDFHAWSLEVDRTPGSWQDETISWMMDGNVFRTLKGSDIGDHGTWATLAHSPFYMILNVAVGGDWPGDPDSSTEDGYGSMMEVEYVAVYSSD